MSESPLPQLSEHPEDSSRSQRFNHLFRVFVIFALVAFLVCLLIGLYMGAWQVTAVGFTSLASLGFGYTSHRFSLQKRPSTAQLLAALGYITAFAAPNLFWINAVIYLLLGGSLVILTAGALLTTRWRQRVGILLFFIACTWIFTEVGWFTRFNIQESLLLSVLLPAITLLILLSSLWLLYRTLQISSIRTRLLISFSAVAVIPLMVAAGVASIIGSKSTVDSAVDLLTSVATLKEDALVSWARGLQAQLHEEYLRDQELQLVAKLLTAPAGSPEYDNAYENLYNRLISTRAASTEFEDFFVLNRQGRVLLSTNPAYQGLDMSQESYYRNGLIGASLLLPAAPAPDVEWGIIVTEPVKGAGGEALGVLAGYTRLDQAAELLQDVAAAGETVETYLVDSGFNLLTPSQGTSFKPGETQVMSRGALNAILGKQSGSGTYENYNANAVIGVYRWLPELNLALLAEQSREEVFAPTINTMLVNTAVSILLVIGTIIFAIAVTQSISRPLAELTRTSQRIAGGELEITADVGPRKDEIAVLATSFNRMTEQLRGMIGGLEELVMVRTRQLAARSDQLQAASQLASAATSILDTTELITRVVRMMQEEFDLYYVGLFLLDEGKDYAVLRAGTGSAGQAMVARGHRIKVGQGMIGWCIVNAAARVSQEASEDTIRLETTDLPDTRSEAAFPLRSRGQVLGAISVQSRETNAFDPSTVATFQTMADQVAIAIDNARLFAEAQSALEATRRAYGELSHRAWLERLSSRNLVVQRSQAGLSLAETIDGSVPAEPTMEHEVNGSDEHAKSPRIEAPIKVRGAVIGYIYGQKEGSNGYWSREEIDLLANLADQLGIALDSARLFEETLLRAEQERLVSDITNRVRETLDLETVLRTAAKEMQKILDLEEVEVRVNQG